MSATNGNDVNVLIPPPHIFRVGGEELRLQALPVKRLLAVVQYVQDNVDLLDKLSALDKPGEGAKFNVAEFLEADVYRRMNGLIRLLFDKATAEKMTDEWCLEHLSNAHYWAIIQKALQQNQLEGLFRKAGEFLGQRFSAFLRQFGDQGKKPELPVATA